MSIFKNYKYIFYDLETTGQNACFDQVIRFAAKETDCQLNILKHHNIDIKLRNDIQKGFFGKLLHASVIVRWMRDKSYYNQAKWRGTWKFDGGVVINSIDLALSAFIPFKYCTSAFIGM